MRRSSSGDAQYDKSVSTVVASAVPNVSVLSACFTIFNCAVGSGLLALAFAVRCAGILCGAVGLLLFYGLSCYTVTLLSATRESELLKQNGENAPLIARQSSALEGVVQSSSAASVAGGEGRLQAGPAPLVSYVDLADATLGKWGRRVVTACLVSTQVGFCCAYVVFTLNNLHKLWPVDKALNLCVIFAIFFGMTLIPDLSWLALSSMFANVVIATAATLIISCAFNPNLSPPVMAPWDYRPLINTSHITLGFGVACFAYCVHGLVIPVKASMRSPRHFHRVLVFTMGVVFVVYSAVGLVGYMSFRDGTKADITENMADVLPERLVNVVKICICLSLFCGYPLQIYPVMELAFGAVQPGAVGRVLVKFAVVSVTVAIGLALPFFGLVVSLVGSVSNSALMFTLPAAMYIKTSWNETGLMSKFGHGLIVAFGLAAAVVCGVSTAIQLARCISDPHQSACS